jgi:hypothetical protein
VARWGIVENAPVCRALSDTCFPLPFPVTQVTALSLSTTTTLTGSLTFTGRRNPVIGGGIRQISVDSTLFGSFPRGGTRHTIEGGHLWLRYDGSQVTSHQSPAKLEGSVESARSRSSPLFWKGRKGLKRKYSLPRVWNFPLARTRMAGPSF